MRNCFRTLHRREFLLAAGAGVASSLALQGVEPSLAPTPPMGWMSWNQFGPDVSEKLVLEVAGVLVSSGMKDLGYKYICLDDYWCTSRDAKGQFAGRDSFHGRHLCLAGVKSLSIVTRSSHLDSREYPRINIYELSRASSDSGCRSCERIWPLDLPAAEKQEDCVTNGTFCH